MAPNILPVGSVIDGRYQTLGLLGIGGMGTVYKCCTEDNREEIFALKLLRSVKDDDLIRFRNEIVTLYSVNHPNVVKPFDVFRNERHVGFTMEYVHGGDLRGLLKEHGKLEWKEVLHLIEQIAMALQAVHATGVIHRDIKPENILLPARNLVRVTDFGTVLSSNGPRITAKGSLLGTVYYISPEYIEFDMLDTRSDIYSLGSVAYELLTGEVPFPGETLSEILNAKLMREASSVYDKDVECPPEIEALIAKTLRRNPDKRFQSAIDLLVAIRECRQVLANESFNFRPNVGRLGIQYVGSSEGSLGKLRTFK